MNKCQLLNLTIQRLCNSVPPILPVEYQQVEWIQGGNDAYIDTGIIVYRSLGYSATGIFGTVNNDYYTAIGARRDINNGSYLMGVSEGVRLGYGNLYQTGKQLITSFSFIPRLEQKFNYTTEDGTTGSVYVPLGSFDVINLHFYIGALNNNGSVSSSSAVISNFKIYDETTLAIDFVPCYRKSDSKTGMYDIISKTFFPNLGTSEFTVGNNV